MLSLNHRRPRRMYFVIHHAGKERNIPWTAFPDTFWVDDRSSCLTLLTNWLKHCYRYSLPSFEQFHIDSQTACNKGDNLMGYPILGVPLISWIDSTPASEILQCLERLSELLVCVCWYSVSASISKYGLLYLAYFALELLDYFFRFDWSNL